MKVQSDPGRQSGGKIHRLMIENEFAFLKSVIIGLGEPYQEDKEAVLKAMGEYRQIPNTEHRAAVMRAGLSCTTTPMVLSAGALEPMPTHGW